MRKGISGEYKSIRLRSFNEFIYAMYLDHVKRVSFQTEPFSLKSSVCSKRKIPDFLYVEPRFNLPTLVEIKSNYNEFEEVVNNYATHKYIGIEEYDVKFVNFNRHSKKQMIATIVDVIGKDEWDTISNKYINDFRSKNKSYGFPGELNPRFGVKVSNETKQRMKDSFPDRSGTNNTNYGKTHTLEAKRQIAAKWSDETRKKAMIKKGMVTHISRYTDEEYLEFLEYATSILNGVYVKRPKFVNMAYTISIEKINSLFGNKENFLREVYR